MHIRVGTRGSKLALAQTGNVIDTLKEHFPEHTFETVIITTKGDRIQHVSLEKIGDKGIFVKEIEQQLLNGTIDMAVHSMKDMPSVMTPGLCFSKTWKREDARDIYVLKEGNSLAELSCGAVLATGSKRRSSQLKELLPQIETEGIRGNVDTRLRKLEEQPIDGIIMAAAGFHRLGLKERITGYFSYDEMIPACCQGALALQLREDNQELLAMVNALGDEETHACIECERAFLGAIEGSCHIPVGGICEKQGDGYVLRGIYGDENCECLVKANFAGREPQALGKLAAKRLLQMWEEQHG